MCRPGFFLDTHRGQEIEIGTFAAGLPEILHLHKALSDQGVDEEVDLAEADPQSGGKLTLGHRRRSVDLPEDPEYRLAFKSIRWLNGHPLTPSRSFREHCAEANQSAIESQDKDSMRQGKRPDMLQKQTRS
jgi:hypothetical protein